MPEPRSCPCNIMLLPVMFFRPSRRMQCQLKNGEPWNRNWLPCFSLRLANTASFEGLSEHNRNWYSVFITENFSESWSCMRCPWQLLSTDRSSCSFILLTCKLTPGSRSCRSAVLAMTATGGIPRSTSSMYSQSICERSGPLTPVPSVATSRSLGRRWKRLSLLLVRWHAAEAILISRSAMIGLL